MAAGTCTASRFPRLVLVIVCLAVFFTALPSFQDGAFAQEVIRRRGIFDLLFGPPRREQLPPARQPQRTYPQPPGAIPQRRAPPAATRRQPTRAAPAPAPEPAIEKLQNARVVLVVGDFLASGLAEGLEAAYAESPGVRIIDRSNGSSGFVRDDYYDWNSEIIPILEEVQPDVMVVMIGSNDRQQLVVNGQRESPQSEQWLEEYTRRVTAFAGAVETADVPLIWTGLPPFKSSSMSSDMLAFNDIHSRAAEAAGGTFVDIWEGFVDENGAFVFTGPDMNGQPVRLRGSDGINLTRPAKRKVAFYVEKPLGKLLGGAVAPGIEQLDIENLPEPGVALGEPADSGRTAPISLAGPDLGSGTELLGATSTAAPDRPAPEAQPGRADNFSLRRQREAPVVETDEETTTAVEP
ncbi:DUF459 domain-containing protein [Chelativorans salis]|uniref:DUF459 domain-containing protein n=1 Tax=Chelativorans salis TaxID=2978478 RepID=A0ABT2LSJ8_9HYPH|nr:DUF459 domain-containing protein [Chelativorans sp. EGI FJ00035]MCT7377512.1 DUF459 domain-containing protein [Chelativorans sp. EGI FJ00035]